MEQQKMRKCLKLLTLLISSLLIATVSSQVYNYMFMDATVGVETTGMSFVEGTNPNFTETGGELFDNNQRVTFSGMNGTPGSPVNYSEPVMINNADTDAAGHDIELVLDSWTGDAEPNLYNITISMYNSTNTQQGNSIVLVPGGVGQVETSTDVNIGPSTSWRVEWIVWWNGNATTTDSVQVSLQLVVKS